MGTTIRVAGLREFFPYSALGASSLGMFFSLIFCASGSNSSSEENENKENCPSASAACSLAGGVPAVHSLSG